MRCPDYPSVPARRRVAALGFQTLGRTDTALRIALGEHLEQADHFVIQAPAQIYGTILTFRKFAEVYLAESAKRMATFDPRMPCSNFMPPVMRLALRGARLSWRNESA